MKYGSDAVVRLGWNLFWGGCAGGGLGRCGLRACGAGWTWGGVCVAVGFGAVSGFVGLEALSD